MARTKTAVNRSLVRSLGARLAAGLSLALAAGLIAAPGIADAAKEKKKKAAPAAKASKLTAENKKALGELMGAFKFGQSKDEVIGVLTAQLDERYAEQIAGTTDIYTQDKLRKEKKEERARITKSYVEFQGKKSGWDVSIIDTEFAHNTGETMLVYWENQGGKNQRRFFFFHEGKLYKMFIALDTKQVSEEQRTFDFFRSLMEQRFGDAKEEPGKLTWRTGEFEVVALDKIQFYDAFCLIISDPKTAKVVADARAAKGEEKKDENKILKSVMEKDASDKPSLDEGKDAVNSIIGDKKK
jgi:hypothetical protein